MNAEAIPVTPGAIRALAARYKFQQDRMQEAADNNNEKVMNQAIAAMSKIEAEASNLGLTLDQIQNTPTEIPAKPSAKPAAQRPAATKLPPSVAEKEKVAARAKAIAAEKAANAEAGNKAKQERKPKQPVQLRPCLEGCGELVPGNFKMGHDAKLKSLILKIERGEEQRTSIPEIAQGLVKFKKGEVVENRDGNGKIISKTQEWICTAAPVRFNGRPEVEFTTREE